MDTTNHAAYTPWKAILHLEAFMEDANPRRLTYVEYRLMMSLILHANSEGHATGTYEDLMERSGASGTVVGRCLKALRSLGLIETVTPGKKGQPGVYAVIL